MEECRNSKMNTKAFKIVIQSHVDFVTQLRQCQECQRENCDIFQMLDSICCGSKIVKELKEHIRELETAIESLECEIGEMMYPGD